MLYKFMIDIDIQKALVPYACSFSYKNKINGDIAAGHLLYNLPINKFIFSRFFLNGR